MNARIGQGKAWMAIFAAGAWLGFWAGQQPPPAALAADAAPSAEALAAQEQELVTDVLKAREAYQASLERLRAYYIHLAHREKLDWAEKELTAFHLVVKHPYILELDLPSKDLKADQSIPTANNIFRLALDWMNQKMTMDRGDNLKRAELLFRRMIHDYPNSDKLDDACYYLGEIYESRYFNQPRRAVAFYERAIHYNPDTRLPGRIRAAKLYDEALNNSQRAVELYQDVLRREVDPEQTREATKRLETLVNRRTPARL